MDFIQHWASNALFH